MQSRNAKLIGIFFLFVYSAVYATDVNVIGLTNGKAVVVIDGGRARTLQVGEVGPNGVKLISANSDAAVLEIDGKRQTLTMGQTISSNYASTQNAQVTLVADSSGHFSTTGSINGATVKFLVDTGATMVSMGINDARRAGISYLRGERGFASTANGIAPVYKVKLDNVKLGSITLNNVDGLVHESNSLPVVLLGMSFLSRVEMRREGTTLTLTKRY